MRLSRYVAQGKHTVRAEAPDPGGRPRPVTVLPGAPALGLPRWSSARRFYNGVLTSTFIQDHNSDQLTMPCGIIIYNPKIKQTSLLCQLQGYTYWMKECPLQIPS